MVLGVLLSGAALRFSAIGHKPIWLDEAFSIWMASHGLLEMLDWIVRIDQHPPLYYLLLHGWMNIFGDGAVAVRLLSALCSTLALPFFYATIRRLLGAQVAVWALLLLALSPLQIHYAQEARMYALLTLEVAVLLYLLADWFVPGAAPRSSMCCWVGVGLVQAAIMLTHNTALVYVPLALHVALLGPMLAHRWGWRRSEPLRMDGWPGVAHPHFLRYWVLAQGLAVALWLPWVGAFVTQAAGVDQSFWMQPPNWGAVLLLFQELHLAHLPPSFPLFPGWHLLFGLFAVIGIVSLVRRPMQLWLLVLWLLVALIVVPVAVALLVSLRRPIFSTHTLLWLTLPHLTLIAVGVQTLMVRLSRMGGTGPRWSVIVLAAVMIVGQGGALHGYYAYFHKEAWDEAAHFVAQKAQPGDLILFNATWVQLPFEYYFRNYDVDAELRGVPVDLFEGETLEPVMTEADLDYLHALLAVEQSGRSVWLVYSHNWYTDPDDLIVGELSRIFGGGKENTFTDIRIVHFE